jgi:hypothetical protein
LIGFSMGAHVVGLAGHIANGVLPRITGRYSLTTILDPRIHLSKFAD